MKQFQASFPQSELIPEMRWFWNEFLPNTDFPGIIILSIDDPYCARLEDKASLRRASVASCMIGTTVQNSTRRCLNRIYSQYFSQVCSVLLCRTWVPIEWVLCASRELYRHREQYSEMNYYYRHHVITIVVVVSFIHRESERPAGRYILLKVYNIYINIYYILYTYNVRMGST